MGLDMYLMKRRIGASADERPVEVGYWRKANAIHGWFSNHCPSGLDDLQEIIVNKSMLLELKRDCELVLNSSSIVEGQVWNGRRLEHGEWVDCYEPGKVMKDSAFAEEVLPTTEGFFFGSKQYGEWYINDLQHTLDVIDHALHVTDFNEEELIYYAWW